MNTPLRDVLPQRPLICFSEDETVESALQKLKENKILSAPVLRSATEIVGFVDILDLLAFMHKVTTKILTDPQYGESRSLTEDDYRMMRKREKDFKIAQIRELVDYSKRNPFHQLTEDAPLSDVVQLFKKRVHRIAVMDKNNTKLIGILSQSDLLNFIVSRPELFKDIRLDESLNKALPTLEKEESRLISLKPYEQAFFGFLVMWDNDISAITIVNDNNDVCGILSASDLKNVDNFEMLLRPVSEFLDIVRKSQAKSANYVVTCNLESSLADAVKTANKEHVHRLLLIDNNNRATTTLTITDMLNCIFPTATGATSVYSR